MTSLFGVKFDCMRCTFIRRYCGVVVISNLAISQAANHTAQNFLRPWVLFTPCKFHPNGIHMGKKNSRNISIFKVHAVIYSKQQRKWVTFSSTHMVQSVKANVGVVYLCQSFKYNFLTISSHIIFSNIYQTILFVVYVWPDSSYDFNGKSLVRTRYIQFLKLLYYM